MPHYEYKVVPAPTKGEKTKGVKTPEGRFAHTVESELNRMGGAGWEYVRAELLPSEERSGLKSTTTQWRTVLIFRREREMGGVQSQPFEDDAPLVAPTAPVAAPVAVAAPEVNDPPFSRANVEKRNVVSLPSRSDGTADDDPDDGFDWDDLEDPDRPQR